MIEEERDTQKMIERLNPWKDFYRKAEVQCHGKKFEQRSYGLCHWSKIILRWEDGQEFYRLTRNMITWMEKGDRNTPRSEYFDGRLVRRYKGGQNCFLEFVKLLQKRRRFPNQRIFARASRELGLDTKITIKYIEFYEQCFLD